MDDAKVDRLARVFDENRQPPLAGALVGAVIGTLRQQKAPGISARSTDVPQTGRRLHASFWLLRRAHVCHLSHQHQLWHLCPRRGRDGLDWHRADLPVQRYGGRRDFRAECRRHQPRPRPISRPNGKRISPRSGPARTPKVQSGRHDRTPSGAPNRPVRMSGGRGNRKFLKRK